MDVRDAAVKNVALHSTIRSLDSINARLREENFKLVRKVTDYAKSNLLLRAEIEELKRKLKL